MGTLNPAQAVTEDTADIGVKPHYLVVMGVSGTGKTTVATGVATRLGWNFQEGDALHPQSNVDKMSAGKPLTDEDRAPWLELCRDWLREQVKLGKGAVLTCSALKRIYRDTLSKGLPVEFVHLQISPDVLTERMNQRSGHFMPPSLLPSQLATLEEPGDDEPVIRVSGEAPPPLILEQLLSRLRDKK